MIRRPSDDHGVLGVLPVGGAGSLGAEPRPAAPAGVGPERVGEGWLLRNVVKVLRRKLGDDAANPRFIITEPRVGYWMAAGEGATDADDDG